MVHKNLIYRRVLEYLYNMQHEFNEPTSKVNLTTWMYQYKPRTLMLSDLGERQYLILCT